MSSTQVPTPIRSSCRQLEPQRSATPKHTLMLHRNLIICSKPCDMNAVSNSSSARNRGHWQVPRRIETATNHSSTISATRCPHKQNTRSQNRGAPICPNTRTKTETDGKSQVLQSQTQTGHTAVQSMGQKYSSASLAAQKLEPYAPSHSLTGPHMPPTGEHAIPRSLLQRSSLSVQVALPLQPVARRSQSTGRSRNMLLSAAAGQHRKSGVRTTSTGKVIIYSRLAGHHTTPRSMQLASPKDSATFCIQVACRKPAHQEHVQQVPDAC